MNDISIQSVSGLGIAGVGYLVVPELKDREQYIKDCYRTNTVTINGGTGYGYIDNVFCEAETIQNLHFPTEENERGTTLIWLKDTISQRPIVIGYLRDEGEFFPLHENQYRVSRKNGSKVVELNLDADISQLQISVLGDKEQPANLEIKVSSESKDSKLSLATDNEITIQSDKNAYVIAGDTFQVNIKNNKMEDSVTMTLKKETGFTYTDEFENEIVAKEDEINITSKKKINVKTEEEINLGEGAEPMVLGETLKGVLEELCDAIGSITVTVVHPGGTVPINNKASFPKIKGKLEDILSKLSNTD